jgi:hypothetical protein
MKGTLVNGYGVSSDAVADELIQARKTKAEAWNQQDQTRRLSFCCPLRQPRCSRSFIRSLMDLQPANTPLRHFTLQIWRQPNRQAEGRLVKYSVQDISPDISFLVMLDVLNEALLHKGNSPVGIKLKNIATLNREYLIAKPTSNALA